MITQSFEHIPSLREHETYENNSPEEQPKSCSFEEQMCLKLCVIIIFFIWVLIEIILTIKS
jgi:hypothetical protein